MVTLDDRHGEIAVSYARGVIERYLDDGTFPEPSVDATLLTDERGAFVTLEADDDLRGCIGRPYPKQTGFEAIRQGAVGAATNDPRFPPVTTNELADITVEVSLLSAPTPVTASGEPHHAVVEVGRDGLIVKGKGRSGLLLPQVPLDQGWTVVEFLQQTCRKAGMGPNCWRDDDIAVERFTAGVFTETEPRGDVDRVPLEEASMG